MCMNSSTLENCVVELYLHACSAQGKEQAEWQTLVDDITLKHRGFGTTQATRRVDFVRPLDLAPQKSRLTESRSFSPFAAAAGACTDGPCLSYWIKRSHTLSTSSKVIPW